MLWPQAMAGVVGCARGIQPPRAGRCQRCPSLSKEGILLGTSFTYVALL
jgi:hypothetical protein